MINQGYTEGINIVESTPYPFQSNVDVSTKIKLKLNTAPNSNTIYESIRLVDVRDMTKEELDNVSLTVLKYYPSVECFSTYNHENRIIEIQPRDYLDINNKYIIIVEGLEDIYGNKQISPYICLFYTNNINTYTPVQLIYPPNNAIIDKLTEFQWVMQNSIGYIFEISKLSDFSVIEYKEEIVDKEKIKSVNNIVNFLPSIKLSDNKFYWRVQSIEGSWSEVNVFDYKSIKSIPVTDQDTIMNDAAFDEIFNVKKVELVNSNIEHALIKLNQNIILLEISAPIDEEEIDELLLYSDLDDVSFQYTILTNEENQNTTIIIVPDEIGGEN